MIILRHRTAYVFEREEVSFLAVIATHVIIFLFFCFYFYQQQILFLRFTVLELHEKKLYLEIN